MDDEDGRKGRDNPIYEMAMNLTDEQIEILLEAIKAGKEGRKYYRSDETGQYDFGFKHGGKVCRGRKAAGSAETKAR